MLTMLSERIERTGRHTRPTRTLRLTRPIHPIRTVLALGMLVALAASCSTTTDISTDSDAATRTEARSASAGNDADAPGAVEPEPTPTPEPTPEPTAEPEPEPDEADDADQMADADEMADETDDETDDDAGAELDTEDLSLFGTGITDDLSPEEIACVMGDLSERPELIRQVDEAEFLEDLPLDIQADLAMMAFDCAPESLAGQFTAGLAETGPDLPPEVGECFIEFLSSDHPQRRDLILGFVALGNNEVPPAESHEPVIDVMSECIPGSVLGDVMVEEIVDDPAVAGAFDEECLVTSMEQADLRPIWELFVTNPDQDFEDLDPAEFGPLIDAMIGCLSLGALMQSELDPLGIELSDESMSCMDGLATGLEFEDLLNPEQSDLMLSIMGCFSPEELAALGG